MTDSMNLATIDEPTSHIKQQQNLKTKKEASKRKFEALHDSDISSEHSSLPPSSGADSITKLTRTEALRATLLEVETERRSLLRQLHKKMHNTASQSTSKSANDTILPSMSAHLSPPPPLTPAEEAEASEHAHAVIKEHIRLLQEYNQIRDVGQGLIGMVAESRRVRVRDCQEEFGVTDGD